jgi:hypothetical protein
MIIYIAGPMSGYLDNNYPAFNEAAEHLRGLGHTVLNPAENCLPIALEAVWSNWMRLSLKQLLSCEIVYWLPGSFSSQGALLELELAEKLGIPVRAYYSVTAS